MGARHNRVYFRGPWFSVGDFSCRAGDEDFHDTGPTDGFLLVFPRTTSRITHCGRASELTDSTRIVLYNKDQAYRRDLVDPRGDYCEWIDLCPELLVEAISPYDPSVAERPHRPFQRVSISGQPRFYLKQRLLLRQSQSLDADPSMRERPFQEDRIRSINLHESSPHNVSARDANHCIAPEGKSDSGDAHRRLEDEYLELLLSIVEHAFAADRPAASFIPSATEKRHRELAQAAREWIDAHYRDSIGLREIARVLGVSPFHLARVFRRQCSMSVREYLDTRRLNRALEELEDPSRSITDIAYRLGYCSHSHFGSAFRRRYGRTPSTVRAALKRSRPA